MTDRERSVLLYHRGKMNDRYLSEAKFLKDAKQFLAMLDKCLIIREANATVNGVADLLVCYNGRFVACELKREGGYPSQQQIQFIDKVIAAGGLAKVCRDLNDIWDLLECTAWCP